MRRSQSTLQVFIVLVMFCVSYEMSDTVLAADSEFFGSIIHSISYKADQPVDPSHYDPYLGFKPGDTLTRTGLKSAIQSLYDTGQFSQIAVDASPEGDGVRIRFDLQLNYYFNEFSIEGDVDLKSRSPSEVMPLPVGEPFTREKLEEARQTFLEFMHGRGFFLAEVQTQTQHDEKNRQVDTTFVVSPGKLATITSIEVRGVPPTIVPVVVDKLDLERGKKYDRERTRRRLENLREYFLKRGFLAAVPTIAPESFDPLTDTVAVAIDVANYGMVRVTVDGFNISKDRVRRLLPILSGSGFEADLLQEGIRNLHDYVEELGYPEAEISIDEETDEAGVRLVRYQVETGRKVTVSDVDFKGNGVFSKEKLLETVQIQPARFLQKSVYSVQKLDSDVESLRSLYQSVGYLQAQVIPLIEPVKGVEKLRITFEIEEGSLARTQDIGFQGNEVLTKEFLSSKTSLKPGGPYSPYVAERDRQAILTAYNDAGFLQPRVTYRASEPDSANAYRVEFQIVEGIRSFIDDVIVLGNRRTREGIVEKRIQLAKDDPLSLSKMLETQQALYSLGVFDRVRVSPQNPESTAAYQDVIVRLEEARQLTLGYGLGYHERERLRGTLEVRHSNVFGRARRADLRLRGSRLEQGVVLSLQQPQIRFLNVDSYFTFSGRVKREVSFDAKRFNLSYQFGRPLNDHSWALLRYNFRNVRVSNLKVSVSELGRQDTPRNLSTLSAIYINDTRDNYLDPEKGFFTSTDLSLTTKWLGSRNNFVTLFTQNHYYRKLPQSLLFSASVRFGVARPYAGETALPISERFFAGGGSSLRGFEIDHAGPLDPNTHKPVGGNALLIANTELRVPLLRSVQLAGFYDTGNIFRNLGDVRFSDFSHTVGLGFRIKTPFGPVRVDYGFNLNLPERLRMLGFKRGHLHVSIGPTF